MTREERSTATVRTLLIGAALLLVSGCFIGDENEWASRRDVIQAAARCGVANFEPTEAPGGAYAAYVPREIPEAKRKEDCIYADLERQGVLATR